MEARKKKKPAKQPRLRGTERKREILRTAMDLFARNGFKGTTVRRLAREAGVTEAVIYRHFPSKQALYDAILQIKFEEIQHILPVDAVRGKDDRAVVETLVGAFLQAQARDSSFMRLLLFSALEGHELARVFFQRLRGEVFCFLGGYLEKRMEEGAFRPINGGVAARLVMGMSYYFAILREVLEDPDVQEIDLDDLTVCIADLFFEGIRKRSDG